MVRGMMGGSGFLQPRAPGENPKALLLRSFSLSLSLTSQNSHVVAPDDLEARQGDLLHAGLGRER